MVKLRLDDYALGKPLYAVFRKVHKEIQAHSQDFHEVMHVTEGSGTHIINGEHWDIFPGQSWYIGDDDWHSIRPATGGLSWINVAFREPSWQAFKSLSGIGETIRVMENRSRTPFDDVLNAYLTGDLQWALAEFLVRSLKPPSVGQGGPEWLKNAVALLDSPKGLQGGVKALREIACVSPAYLTRAAKSIYGMTPTDLVNKKRLEYAALLLSSSSIKIVDVTSQCGFESVSYFFRIFRGTYGMTPLAFRRSRSML